MHRQFELELQTALAWMIMMKNNQSQADTEDNTKWRGAEKRTRI